MTLLASPASLKGVLSAVQAAAALVEGAGAGAEALPIADGGGGTAEVLAASLGGSWHEAVVSDPLGRPVSARWLMLPDRTAVVEAAAAIGLARLGPDELDPMHASSRGLGELVHAALEAGPDELLVCLGDSATVDGGAGLMEVLGGFPVPARAACDVRNPLLGPRGAARAFAPQKGATAEQVEELEARLAARRSLRPVAGPAGGGRGGGPRRRPRRSRRGARPGRRARPRPDRLSRAGARRRPRRHGRGNDRRGDARGEGSGRGAPGLPRGGHPLRRLRRPDPGAASGRGATRAQRRSRACARGSDRPRPAAGLLRSRAPRAAAWRAPGAASTRCARYPRRADGTPRKSGRSTSGRCPQ